MSPASMRSVVVLPAPLGPSRAKISPAAQLERDIVDRHAIAEAARQVLRGQRVRGHEDPCRHHDHVSAGRTRSNPGVTSRRPSRRERQARTD